MWFRMLFLLALLLAPATSQVCIQCGGSPLRCYPPEGQGRVFTVYCNNNFAGYLDCCHDDCSYIRQFRCFGWLACCSIEHYCENWGEDRCVPCPNCF